VTGPASAAIPTTVFPAVALAACVPVTLSGGLDGNCHRDDGAGGQCAAGLHRQHGAWWLPCFWQPYRAWPQAKPAQVCEHNASWVADETGAAYQDRRR